MNIAHAPKAMPMAKKMISVMTFMSAPPSGFTRTSLAWALAHQTSLAGGAIG
jgi:hypothetical protein